MVKKFLLFFIYYISSNFRPFWLLKIFKLFKKNFLIKKCIHHFDPNVIRKNYFHSFTYKEVKMHFLEGVYYVDINDHLGYKFFLEEGFDNFLLMLGKKLNISEKDILLDIGANIGTTCIPFAISTGAEVIGIEASKHNASLLLKNAYANNIKIDAYINCVVDGISNPSNKWIKMFHKDGNRGANSIFKSWNPSLIDNTEEYVLTTTIDNIINGVEKERIKLVKLDVEGSESIVLKGAKSMLKLNIPLVFEYRIDLNTEENVNNTDLVKLLSENSKLFGIKKINNNFFLTFFDHLKSYENAIAIPNIHLDRYLDIFEGNLEK